MRPDVKLGVVISLVFVLVAGGYYLYRDSREVPIPVTGNLTAASKKADSPVKSTTADARREESRLRPQSAADRARGTRSGTHRQGWQGEGIASTPPTEGAGKRTEVDSTRVVDRQAKRAPTTEPASRRGRSQPRGTPGTRHAEGTPRSPKRGDTEASPGSGQKSATPGSKENLAKAAPPGSDRSSIAGAASESPRRRVRQETKAPQEGARRARQGSTTLASAAGTRPASGRKLEARPAQEMVETHRVQLGDTLASLARDYYGHEKYTQFLVDQNPQIPDPNRLRIGMSVRIPPRPVDDGRPAATSPRKTTASLGSDSTRPSTYTVEPGDSFYGIARSVLGDASRWEELFALNKDLVHGNPKRLQVGHVLTLPD